MRRIIVFALISALATVPRVSGAADPYEINALVPQTGASALMGKAFTSTLNVIEGMVDKAGGIQGRPIKFVITDDQTNAQLAVQLISGLVAKHAPVVLGPLPVANCEAALPLLQNGPVMYCISPAIHPAAGSFAVSAGVSTLSSLEVLAHYFRERGWYKVGLITSIDVTGREAEQSFDHAIGLEKGETVVDREHFNTSDISVAAQMTHLAASGAQVIVAWAIGVSFGTVIRGAHDAGINVPVATANVNLIYSLLEQLRPYLPKDLYFPGIPSAASVAQLPRGPLKSAEESYIDAFQSAGIRPEIGEYQVWDAAWIIIDALKKLGLDATAPQIRDYVASLHGWVGVHGPYDFQAFAGRGIGAPSIVVVHWEPARDTWVNVSLPGGAPTK